MAHLPVVGGDLNDWGSILNEYLRVSHNEDGTLKNAPGAFNAKAYGARGDGSDATAAIQAAADACAAAGGGIVFLPAGGYLITGTIRLTGVRLLGASSALKNAAAETTYLQHGFNGNMIEFYRGGGGVENLYLNNNDVGGGVSYTGAAFYALSDGTNQSPGRVFVKNCVVSGGTQGWERIVYADGTLSANGVRQWHWESCVFFGGSTIAGEAIVAKKAVHWSFMDVALDDGAAPAGTTGIKIYDQFSTDIFFSNCSNAGTFYTEAAGNSTSGNQPGVMFSGAQVGNITCAAGSAKNVFLGRVWSGTFTNSGEANRRDSEIEYTEKTSSTTVSATVEASSDTVFAGTARVYPAEPIVITFSAARLVKGTSWIRAVLFDGATPLGIIAENFGASSTPVAATRRLTPTAGSHTYGIRCYVDAGSGAVSGGSGGAATYMPATLRIGTP